LDVRVYDDALGLRRLARPKQGERCHACVIFVAQRQVQDEVFVPEHAEPSQLFGDAFRGFCARRRR
jgi:hypothetical protein